MGEVSIASNVSVGNATIKYVVFLESIRDTEPPWSLIVEAILCRSLSVLQESLSIKNEHPSNRCEIGDGEEDVEEDVG